MPSSSPSSTSHAAAIRSLHLPEARHKALIGCSHGWLFLIDEAGSVSLLNPFTRARFLLPPVSASLAHASGVTVSKIRGRWVIGRKPVTLYHMRSTFIADATLSSSPSSGDGSCAVLVSSTKLAFCRIGDREWTLLETTLRNDVSSVVHCNGRKMNQLMKFINRIRNPCTGCG